MDDKADGPWVFGYGSLMWRPGFAYVERRPAVLHGRRSAENIFDRTMERLLAMVEAGEADTGLPPSPSGEGQTAKPSGWGTLDEVPHHL